MNRRNFFKNLGIAVAAIAVSKPIIEALSAPGPCNSGLIWQIENHGSIVTYETLDMKMMEKFIGELMANQDDLTPTCIGITSKITEEEFRKLYEA